jgi:hypothetical protein
MIALLPEQMVAPVVELGGSGTGIIVTALVASEEALHVELQLENARK